jgi:cytohesin
MVRGLLELGATPNATESSTGIPVLNIAVTTDVRIVRLLLAGGADPNLRDKCGNTALHTAARTLTGGTGYFRLLSSANADPDIHSESGCTVLHPVTACRPLTPDSDNIISVLLDSGRCDVSIRNNNGETAKDLVIRRLDKGIL